MYSFIEQWTAQHRKMEIMEKCQAAGCPITAAGSTVARSDTPPPVGCGRLNFSIRKLTAAYPSSTRIRTAWIGFLGLKSLLTSKAEAVVV